MSLHAGTYQVAITFRDVLGRESGTGRAALVQVAEGGSIVLSGIPQPVDSSVVTVRVYVSDHNGDVLHHRTDLPVGVTTATISGGAGRIPLATQFQEPLPPGQVVGVGHGRLFVGRGRVVYWSEALRYGQGVLASSYMRFGVDGDQVDVLAPVGGGTGNAGVFVACGNRTYWLAGADPSNWAAVTAYPSGATPGTLAWASGEVWGLDSTAPVPSWLALNGQFCVGLPGGQVVSYNADTCSTQSGGRGASLIRDQDGQRHMLVSLRGANEGVGIGDTVATTVRRNGVVIP